MDRDLELEFESFVQAQEPHLLRTAVLLTGDAGHAEDLLQEVLEKTYLRWGRIRAVEHPELYVRRTLVNSSIDRWRRLRSRVREVALGPRDVSGSAEPMALVDDRDLVLRALRAVPPRQRAVLVLRYWDDLSEAEIAQVLQCTVGTVKSQASRGLDRMRALMAAPAQPASGHPTVARATRS